MIIGTVNDIRKAVNLLKNANSDLQLKYIVSDLPLKTMKNTAILFHKSKFDLLQRDLTKKIGAKEFEKKTPFLINITNHIQVAIKNYPN